MAQVTFGKLLSEFVKRCEERGLAFNTVRSYRYTADKFLRPTLGAYPVERLEARHLERVYGELFEQGYSRAVVQRCKVTAQAALKYGMRERYCYRNVAQLSVVPLTGEGEGSDLYIPTAEDVKRFLSVAKLENPDIHDYGRFLASSGCRCGEAAALNKADLQGRILTVSKSLLRTNPPQLKSTKTRRVRRISLDEKTVATLLGRPHYWLFGNAEGPVAYGNFARDFREVARLAGVDFQARHLRHYHATQLLANGVNIKQVADRLGHANPMVTLKTYAKFVPALDEAAADLIGGLLD